MKWKTVLKHVIMFSAVILLAFTIQTCIFPLIPVFSSVPNLLLVLTFSFGFIYGSNTGMFCGAFAGLLMDFFYSGTFGFYSLFFIIMGYVNGIFTRYYYDDAVTLPLFFCIGNELCYHLYIYVVRFLVRGRVAFGFYFMHIILPELLFSLLVTLLIYRFLLKFTRRFEEKAFGLRFRKKEKEFV